jgi:hypothetical protein
MTRAQRRTHLLVWLLLAPSLAVGLFLALTGRLPPAAMPSAAERGRP